MASDRILIVRIYGIGFYDALYEPLTLTSRAGLGYLPKEAIEGVVTDMSDQFSSELAMFAAIGSDPTTSFSVLATSETMPALLARGMTEVRDAAGIVVRTKAYVEPNPLMTVECSDTSTLQVLDTVRIGGMALLVTNILSGTTFEAQNIFGSVPVPVTMSDISDEPQGAVIYGMRYLGNDYQMGGIEQLPVVISSAPLTANSQSEETVLFRGSVSKVSLNCSMGSDNQIKVECQSIMGMILNKPFRPTPSPMFFGYMANSLDDQLYDWLAPDWSQTRRVLGAPLNTRLQGSPWEYNNAPFSTRIGMFQARKDGEGAIMPVQEVISVGGELVLITSPEPGGTAGWEQISNFTLAFKNGFYGSNSGGMSIPVETQNAGGLDNGGVQVSWEDVGRRFDAAWVGESSFTSANIQSLIIDLLFGTFNADTTGAQGVRESNMAAWLPFDWSTIFDIVDAGTLNSVFNDVTLGQDFPRTLFIDPSVPQSYPSYATLPYKHNEVKTIGDVLRFILQRVGAFMVYDRGRISFGKWIGNGAWPQPVTDAALATPSTSLLYDRDNALQLVEVEGLVPGQGLSNKFVRPITNADRVISGSGKTMKVGVFNMPTSAYQAIETTSCFQNAVALIQKYSLAAAIVEVTYRNGVVDLSVGQEVFFSSDYVPNGAGTMGVLNASGVVLKSARAWETPTTSYTLFLPGYVFASNRPSVVGVSGVVVHTAFDGTDTTLTIDVNVYTDPSPLAVPNAPTSDAIAFNQTLEQNGGNPVPCHLQDTYGTIIDQSLLTAVNTGTNELLFPGSNFNVAVPGDVITLHLKTPQLDIAECWDAFQADGSGQVDSSVDLAYPWVR